VVRPVQVVRVPVVRVPVVRVLRLQPRAPKAHVQAQALAQAQWGNAQGVLASLVKLLARAPTWLDRTLA
jgi:hypothetical protein